MPKQDFNIPDLPPGMVEGHYYGETIALLATEAKRLSELDIDDDITDAIAMLSIMVIVLFLNEEDGPVLTLSVPYFKALEPLIGVITLLTLLVGAKMGEDVSDISDAILEFLKK